MQFSRKTIGLTVIVVSCFAPAATDAQRVRPPTMLAQQGAPPAGATFGQGGVVTTPPTAPFAPTTPFVPATPPPALPPGTDFDPYATAPPPAYPYATTPPPAYAPAPAGTIPPVPYGGVPADPAYSTSPPALYPNSDFQFWTPQGDFVSWKRFLQGIRLQYTWLGGGNARELGINDFDVGATFAFPIFPDQNYPLLVTPGFGLHLWEGPAVRNAIGEFDLPARAYDGYIDFGWNPQFSDWIGAELAVRPGIYTDFQTFNSNSLRYQGRGMGIVSVTQKLKIAAGVEYLDRARIKLLPAGGVIWEPHERARYEILFPRPKLSHFLVRSSFNTDWWGYLSGELGGGSWTVERLAPAGKDRIDINDIRVMVGVEFKPTPVIAGAAPAVGRSYVGYFEAGYVFEREIIFVSNLLAMKYTPSSTFMLRAGLRF